MADFAKIRARAAKRKGGEAVLASLLGAVPDNAAVADIPDDRILSTMAERVFAAGFVWRVIEQKWPGFEEAFLGFEPKRLLFQPDDFWHDLASDKRIVRNPQKIRSVRDNAAFVERVSKEHGGFGKFLAAMAGRRPGRADGLSRQAWQPARRQYRAIFAALARLGRLHPVARHGAALARCRPRYRRKPDLEEGSGQDPGADQPLGARRPACLAAISRASWPCRSARTIRPKRCEQIWPSSCGSSERHCRLYSRRAKPRA